MFFSKTIGQKVVACLKALKHPQIVSIHVCSNHDLRGKSYKRIYREKLYSSKRTFLKKNLKLDRVKATSYSRLKIYKFQG